MNCLESPAQNALIASFIIVKYAQLIGTKLGAIQTILTH